MAKVQHAAQTGVDLHETKGVAAASENDTLIADGAGSAAWANPLAYIEVSIDLGSTLTRSFVGATAWTDFILDYVERHAKNFSYNDTTKEITYTGTRDIAAQFTMVISVKRTDTGGSPEVSVIMAEDIGAGYVHVSDSIVARSFTGNDVGSLSLNGLHTFKTGDKVKLQVMTDGGLDIAIRNINFSVHSLGVI